MSDSQDASPPSWWDRIKSALRPSVLIPAAALGLAISAAIVYAQSKRTANAADASKHRAPEVSVPVEIVATAAVASPSHSAAAGEASVAALPPPSSSARLFVSELWVYPIKSCRGIRVQHWPIERTGLLHDRRFMVVDADSRKFLTQRTFPRMCLIETEFRDDGKTLWASAPGRLPIEIGALDSADEAASDANAYFVEVWGDKVKGIDQGNAVAMWFSEYLDRDVRVVMMPHDFRRELEAPYVSYLGAPSDKRPLMASFADGYPFLLTTTSSLVEVNQMVHGKPPIDMRRFRPNIVVSTAPGVSLPPFDEELWKKATVGNVLMHGVKPCSRCKVTTVDQDTANVGSEPLHTLREERMTNNGAMFGMNMVHEMPDAPRGAELHVGDAVVVLERYAQPMFALRKPDTPANVVP